MLTFQLETSKTFERECWPLFQQHYEEIGLDKDRMKLEPDVSFYQFLESRGQLQILTARKNGAMIGYQVTVIRPHPHYISTLCGFEDIYFLTESERKGWTGVKLIKESLAKLRMCGVKKVFYHTKCHKPLGLILSRIGFKQSDEVWAMWIGD